MRCFSFRHMVVAIAAVVCCAGQAALAQPLAERVPGDVMAYWGWAGTRALGQQYHQSHLKAVLEACAVPGYVEQAITAQTQAEKMTAQDADMLRQLAGDVALALQCPLAVYVQRPQAWPDQPVAPTRLVLLMDAGADAAALAPRLARYADGIAATYQTSHPVIVQDGGVLGVGFNFPAGEKPILHPAAGRALLEQKGLGPRIHALAPYPAAVLYIDTASLAQWAVDGIIHDVNSPLNFDERARLKTALHTAGVHDLGPYVWAGWLAGMDWETAAEMDCPTPRHAIGMWLAGQPVAADTLALAPAETTYAKAWALDIPALWREVRRISAASGASANQTITLVVKGLQEQTAVNLETDLLAKFGPDWLAIGEDVPSGKPETAWNTISPVLVNKPGNAGRLEMALDKLEQWVSAQMAAMAKANFTTPGMIVRQDKEDGLLLRTVTFPTVFSCQWTVQNGMLFVGNGPQVVSAVRRYAATQPASRPPQEGRFQQVETYFGKHPWSSVMVTDLPRTAGEVYSCYQATLDKHGAEMAAYGIPKPTLPPWEQLQDEFAPAAAVCWSDEHTIYWRTHAPFPGAEYFGTGGIVMNADSMGTALGIARMAVARAQDSAKLAKSKSQVRTVMQACVAYAQTTNGVFPNHLGTLLEGEYVTPDVLTSPRDDKPLPPGIRQWPVDQQVAWIKQNTSYVLVPGQRKTGERTKIFVFEKLHHPDMKTIVVAYGDNHVEDLGVEKARKLIQEQTGRSLEEWSRGQ